MRQWVDQTNEAYHGEIREVSLERAGEKSVVDRPASGPDLHCGASVREAAWWARSSPPTGNELSLM